MKRIITLLCLLLPLTLWGCSAKKTEPEGIVMQDAVQQTPENGAVTVYGKVESIVGNEVVLALGEPQQSAESGPEAPEGQREQTADAPEGQTEQGGEIPEGQKIQMGEAPQGGAPGEDMTFGSGERPGGAGEERPAFGSGGSGRMPSGNVQSIQAGGNSGGMGRNVPLDYSGETETYLLPVGMEIGSGNFSNVSEGMVLALSLNAEGVITAVRILAG